MIQIGTYNTLTVKTPTSVGLYLTDGTEDVLMPNRYVPQGVQVGQAMEVFVYLDTENRPIATTEKPFARVGDFAFLTVKDVNAHGAFLDWGVAKDIFVPYGEQRVGMVAGKSYLVYIFVDEYSGRIAATTKWNKYLEDSSDLTEGQEVQLLIAEKTDLGFRAIINNKHEGLIYQNEVFGDLQPGDLRRGFIKTLRGDGKIDLRLHPDGLSGIEDAMEVVWNYLEINGGILSLGDKSTPEDIYRQLKISKKAFKKAIGGLYKDQRIVLSDFQVQMVRNMEE